MRGSDSAGWLQRGEYDRPPAQPRAWGETPRPSPTTLLSSLALAAVIFGAGRLGLSIAAHPGAVPPVWPASGIAVAAVLLGGRRLLAGIAVGVAATAISQGQPPIEVIGTALAGVVGPLLAVLLLPRCAFRDTLRRTSDVIAFVGIAAVLGTGVGALLGTFGDLASGRIGAGALGDVWRDWWLGDFSGVLIVGGAILVLSDIRPRALRSRETVEMLLVSAAVGAVSYELLSFRGELAYLVLPLLFLLAFSYRQRGATIGSLIVATITVVLTVRGDGPFVGGDVNEELLRAMTFVCVGAITALLVAAAQSERRLAEQAVDRLAESERALAEAQHLARIGSFEDDLMGGRTIWSAELYRILGREPATLPPGLNSWRTCVHVDDRARFDEFFARLYGELRADSIVHRIVRPDGQVRTVEARFRFEDDGSGQPLRLVGTCQDITAMKLAEERFRSLFEHAPYAIVVLREDGRIALSNLRAQQMFGYATSELAGRAVEELIPSPPGDGEPWFARLPNETAAGAMELELRARRRSGEEFAVEVSLTPLVAEQGALISAAIRDVTEIRAAAAALSFQARHDALTGLPNRMMFLEALEQALARAGRSGRSLGVIFLDLDDFKLVNDTRGHDAGDELLRKLTPTLGAAVRLGDTLARLGGDEFVVLCEDLGEEEDAIEIAQRIVEGADEPLLIDGREHSVQISAGVVMVRDPAGASAHSVLRDADAAMYSAKAHGKGRVAVFDESMRARLLEQTAIESSLRGAVGRGELLLEYQPVIELETERIVAAEALLRWRHPVRGLLAPAEFMPVAESSGAIAEIGEWVIAEACRQAAGWRDGAAGDGAVQVSVNVSPYQLTRTDLAGAVQRALRRSGLPAALLELEVTESTLLEDMNASRRELRRLKQLGVRLVVDDFGTGYSSLSALRNLMIDGLKLDRSFVETLGSGDEDDGALMDAVLSMADALDARVTAEGVETWAQVNRLRMHGCGYAQGYLFGRPGPPERVAELIAARDEHGHVVG